MEALHLPKNVKIHFAGSEAMNHYLAFHHLGVRYSLYTAYPFVERKVMGIKKSPIMPLRWMQDPAIEIPAYIAQHSNHTIQDSGLFTLMFGSGKDIKDKKALIHKWYDGLIDYTLSHGVQNVTCVEVDCQKILGVEEAWRFRERMRNDIPNRVINVYHLEDGQKGLDRLIEFSDYIAISVPELRIHKKTNFVPALAKYIKQKKPTIDIHLLGCTDLRLLSECSFCTSADSTSYKAIIRFGTLKGYHKSGIKTQEAIELMGQDKFDIIKQYNNENNTLSMALSIEYFKNKYQAAAGWQDYYSHEIL